MIKLYGSPVSNCYNTVLAALKHKQINVDEHHVSASLDPVFLQHSPMGKIPYITHRGLSISETSAILEYLDEEFPGPSLFPGDTLQRARQRQLMKFVELYVESPGRRLFPGVFWSLQNAQLHIDEVRPVMERGLDAIVRLFKANPSMHEQPPGAADYYSYFSLNLIALVTHKQYDWDLFASHPEIRRYLRKLEAVKTVSAIAAQRDTAMMVYLAKKAAEVHTHG